MLVSEGNTENEAGVYSQKLRYTIQDWLERTVKAGTRLVLEAGQRLSTTKLI